MTTFKTDEVYKKAEEVYTKNRDYAVALAQAILNIDIEKEMLSQENYNRI